MGQLDPGAPVGAPPVSHQDHDPGPPRSLHRTWPPENLMEEQRTGLSFHYHRSHGTDEEIAEGYWNQTSLSFEWKKQGRSAAPLRILTPRLPTSPSRCLFFPKSG